MGNSTQGLSADEIELEKQLGEDGLPREDGDSGDDSGHDLGDSDADNDAAGEPQLETQDEGAAATAASAGEQAESGSIAQIAQSAEPIPAHAYETADVASLREQRTQLRAAEAQIDAQWGDGKLSDEERVSKISAARDELDANLIAITRAETLADANRQTQLNEQRRVIDQIRNAGVAAGIDYNDDDVAGHFDRALQLLAGDAKRKDAAFAELAADADKLVRALLGKPLLDAKPADKPPTLRRQPIDLTTIPPTLARVPMAADAAVAGDEFAHLSSLEGAALERAYTRLTPEQQERWLN